MSNNEYPTPTTYAPTDKELDVLYKVSSEGIEYAFAQYGISENDVDKDSPLYPLLKDMTEFFNSDAYKTMEVWIEEYAE